MLNSIQSTVSFNHLLTASVNSREKNSVMLSSASISLREKQHLNDGCWTSGVCWGGKDEHQPEKGQCMDLHRRLQKYLNISPASEISQGAFQSASLQTPVGLRLRFLQSHPDWRLIF